MATPPKPLSFRLDTLGADVPAWAQDVLEQINTFAAQVSESLTKGITRAENLRGTEKVGLTFTTKATAADTFPIPVAHGLPQNPEHVEDTKLERVDGAAITSAYSMTWRNGSEGQVLVTFQGLSNSTKYRVNMTFE
jgi:hypothetical protein